MLTIPEYCVGNSCQIYLTHAHSDYHKEIYWDYQSLNGMMSIIWTLWKWFVQVNDHYVIITSRHIYSSNYCSYTGYCYSWSHDKLNMHQWKLYSTLVRMKVLMLLEQGSFLMYKHYAFIWCQCVNYTKWGCIWRLQIWCVCVCVCVKN